jgi:hypothetical protein
MQASALPIEEAKMKPTFVRPVIRRSTARLVTWAAVLSSVFLSVAFAQNAATSAQSPPAAGQADPPPSATDARRQAPIGHAVFDRNVLSGQISGFAQAAAEAR